MDASIADTTPVRRLRSILLGLAVGATVFGVVVLLGLRIGGEVGGAGQLSLPIGGAAPDFALETPDGDVVRLADLRGQPVWLTFWATWCPPCRTEMPDLQRAYRESPPGRYAYVAVNMAEDAATVQRYLRDLGYTLPTVLDPTGSVSLQYKVVGLPTHFFIDEAGVLREVYSGAMSRRQIDERVAALW